MNRVAYRAIEGKNGMLPDGSMIVKENYGPEKKLLALTIMYKSKGYNPQADDGFWAKYGPDGKIEAEGKIAMCIGCHGTKKANDYIQTAPLK